MAWTFSSGRLSPTHILLFLCVFIFSGELKSCISTSFKFNIHHRFSDKVMGFLDSEGLPEKHSREYYASMVHRDRLVHGRRLASINQKLIFKDGNMTVLLDTLGYVYYAEVSVGTPAINFLVALDTGSDLFWLPCDCSSCPTYLNSSKGQKIPLNHYSPNASTTSKGVACSSPMCELGSRCSSPSNICPYQRLYVSANTSSTGYLVEDVLHLATDDSTSKPVDSRITFGCGKVQTGIFSKAAAPNGLMGLGMEKISVPSFLASQGLTSDSFSMCFGTNGIGKIEFGDTGSLTQKETPFNPMVNMPSYNVSFTQINVGGKASNTAFTAIFDSGTSFTYLNDPVYSVIAKQFDAGMKLKRLSTGPDFPFEYCYELPATAKTYERPIFNFTMKGGDDYEVMHPMIGFPLDSQGTYAVCLGIVHSTDMYDLIGQNFMTGYSIIFNRDKMVLGWSESECGYGDNSNSPSDSPPADSPPSDSPPADSPPSDSPPSDSPPSDSPPSDSPPSDSPPSDSPPSDSPPAHSPPRSGDEPPPPPSRMPRIGAGATRLNPFGCVFTVILAIVAVF